MTRGSNEGLAESLTSRAGHRSYLPGAAKCERLAYFACKDSK